MFDEGMIAKTYLPSRIRFIPTKKPFKTRSVNVIEVILNTYLELRKFNLHMLPQTQSFCCL